jgi:hypothetical protein
VSESYGKFSKDHPFNLSQVQGAFIVLAIGIGISVVSIMAEMVARAAMRKAEIDTKLLKLCHRENITATSLKKRNTDLELTKHM